MYTMTTVLIAPSANTFEIWLKIEIRLKIG